MIEINKQKKNYVYRSRSYSSYNLAENVKAKMNHGLLELELQKKTATKPEEREGIRVEVK